MCPYTLALSLAAPLSALAPLPIFWSDIGHRAPARSLNEQTKWPKGAAMLSQNCDGATGICQTSDEGSGCVEQQRLQVNENLGHFGQHTKRSISQQKHTTTAPRLRQLHVHEAYLIRV